MRTFRARSNNWFGSWAEVVVYRTRNTFVSPAALLVSAALVSACEIQPLDRRLHELGADGGQQGGSPAIADLPDAAPGGTAGEPMRPSMLPAQGGSGPGSTCADGDEDGACDAQDRCAQGDDAADADGDRTPDACDPCPALANEDATRDLDQDGVPDGCDLCNGVSLALSKQPLFYFSFDEAPNSSLALNRGSVPIEGQPFGPATFGLGGVADSRGTALLVPGAGNTDFPRVTVANAAPFPTTALTALFWVRTRQQAQYSLVSYALADSANEFGVFVDGNLMRLNLEGLTFEQDLAVTTRISDGTWHFIAVTWQSQTAQFFFDGEPVGTPLATTLANAVTRFPTPDPGVEVDLSAGGVLIFGQDQDSLNGGFVASQALDGGLDELAIFDRALTPAEIREVFSATTCGERCDGVDNDGDGTIDEGFQGGAPACPGRPNCAAIDATGSAFGSGTYFLEADPNFPQMCVF
jgi:hypothetical protein